MNDAESTARVKMVFAEDVRQQRRDDQLLATGGLCGLVYAVRLLRRHCCQYHNVEKNPPQNN